MIVGLCGAAGSGKDTVGTILSGRHAFAVISFAGPLYAAVSEFTGMAPAELKDRSVKEEPIPWLGKSPRELLQTLGTQWGRQMVCEDIWVKIAMRRAGEIQRAGWHVCVTDVRFDNEAEEIRAAGGQVWRVERPGAGLAGATGQHESEAGVALALVDQVVLNDGDLGDLEAAVDAALRCRQERRMEVSTP